MTVCTASSILSVDRYLCFFRSFLMSIRIFALAKSRFCQSIILFRRKASASSFVKVLNGSRLAQGVIARKPRRGAIALKRNRDIANGKSDDILAL